MKTNYIKWRDDFMPAAEALADEKFPSDLVKWFKGKKGKGWSPEQGMLWTGCFSAEMGRLVAEAVR